MCATTARSEPSSDRSVLLVNGSPHPDGPTMRLARALTGALPAGTVVRAFGCYDRLPHPCTDCRACHRQAGCAYGDLDDFDALLAAADALVWATPVYHLSFPAPLKALLDRGQRYWAARFVRGGDKADTRRPAVLLTTAGRPRGNPGAMLEAQLKPALTVLGAHLAAVVHYDGGDAGEPLEPALEAARRAGAALFA